MKVLLTGRTGQVGWELERELSPGVDLVPTDRGTLDITDPKAIARYVRASKPDVILNAGAYTAVDRAESERELAFAVNAEAPAVLAQEAKRAGALLVHYSTDYVFDGTKDQPYTEDDPPNPVNVYGESKLAGEHAIKSSGCRFLILRTSWVYGPRGKNFYLSILRLAREQSELRVVSDQVGSPTSSLQIACATAQLLRRSAEGLYHLCAAGETSWFGFAQAILDRAGKTTPVTAIHTKDYPAAARRPRYSKLDCSRLRADTGVALAAWVVGLDEVMASHAAPR